MKDGTMTETASGLNTTGDQSPSIVERLRKWLRHDPFVPADPLVRDAADVIEEMLEALRELRRRLKVPPTLEGAEVWRQLNDAIAKAEGKQP